MISKPRPSAVKKAAAKPAPPNPNIEKKPTVTADDFFESKPTMAKKKTIAKKEQLDFSDSDDDKPKKKAAAKKMPPPPVKKPPPPMPRAPSEAKPEMRQPSMN